MSVLHAEAVGPFAERDLMVTVGVAAVEKVADAVLQSLERGANREQFMPRHRGVPRFAVERAPAPHCGVGPALRLIQLSDECEGRKGVNTPNVVDF